MPWRPALREGHFAGENRFVGKVRAGRSPLAAPHYSNAVWGGGARSAATCPTQSNRSLLPRQSEHLVLLGPFGGQIGKAGHSHAAGRPSIAALTSSGARKASEIVMFTLRMLHPSRFAMLSVLAVARAMSSLSQRRPRAIDATSLARFSERMRRACCGGVPSGSKISRRRVDGAFCHGTESTFAGRVV